ncbi:Uncharacterised protein [Enterobacter cloacae]|nr:Uncharacterised protein [Enterobacter cloacae]
MKTTNKIKANKIDIETQIDNGVTLKFIAEKMNVSYTSLHTYCKRMNIRTKRVKN